MCRVEKHKTNTKSCPIYKIVKKQENRNKREDEK